MNSTEKWTPTDEDPRLVRAAQEYLAAVEAGQRPDREAFAARHAELFPALAPYLDAVDLLHAAPPLPAPEHVAKVADPAAEEPTALGDFRIERELGRGGMGVVYEAVQLSLGRRVALKVLPFAATLDAKQLQRFKNEAQAAAQLHHTNIVPVYAVGSERGVHYYAMQLIDGQNLADLIGQLARLKRNNDRTSPTGNDVSAKAPALPPSPPHLPTVADLAAALSTQRATRSPSFYQAAARLIAQAAEALEHAHQFGVVHRDIKPANLLVDARGNVWVTDFGLAQYHSSIGLTRTGDLMGTLRYMSPEQAGGVRAPVDARTDVYSLGATLYELLTLEPLFGGIDYPTLLRQVLHDEPAAPRSIDRWVPAELETIVLKAVSKNPAERYATAQEFADDLHRFLENRPVLARRPTLFQRARKWGQRHPSFVAASVVVLVLFCLGSLVSTAIVHGEQAKVQAAYKNERDRAEEAEARLRLAQQAVNELMQVSEEELTRTPGTERLRKRLLESVLAYNREFIEQRSNDPKGQEELRDTKKRVEQIIADLTVLQANGRLDLLRQPAVVDDLHLADEQGKQVEALNKRLKDQRQQFFGSGRALLSPEEARKLLLEQAKANDESIHAILSPEQLARLPQIALQQQGTGAFREADVAAALKLTPKQRERIRGYDEEVLFTWMQEGRRPGGPSPSEDVRKANEQKRKEAMQNILALLTPEQTKQWNQMIGESFKGPAPFFPPFFGPGPPGGPGGPGGRPKGGPPPDRPPQ